MAALDRAEPLANPARASGEVRLAFFFNGCGSWIPIGLVAIVAGMVVATSSGDGWLFLLTASSGTMLGYAAVVYAMFLYLVAKERSPWLERHEDGAMWLILVLVGLPIPLLVSVPVLSGYGLAVLGAALILTPPAIYILGELMAGLLRFLNEGS